MILPIIKNLLDQTILLPSERAVILDGFYKIKPEEELEWLNFLEEQPDFFDTVSKDIRNLEIRLKYEDKSFLNSFFDNLARQFNTL